MNTEQKRIKIVEACGWRYLDSRPGYPRGIAKDGVTHELPDYFNDLNAMHEAEKVLTEKGVNTWWAYVDHLNRNNPTPFGHETAVHATAAQRAEAFGLTLNLWEKE